MIQLDLHTQLNFHTLGVVVVSAFKLVLPVLITVAEEGTAVGLIVVPKKNFNTKNLNIAQDC